MVATNELAPWFFICCRVIINNYNDIQQGRLKKQNNDVIVLIVGIVICIIALIYIYTKEKYYLDYTNPDNIKYKPCNSSCKT